MALVVMISWLAYGCAATPIQSIEPLEFEPELLSGQLLFGDAVSMDLAPEHDILGADEAMRAFVGDIAQRRLSVVRFNQLIDKLEDSGFFNNTYDADVTLTATETFHQKTGNCISYTNLFVVLARLAGLEVEFQIAPPVHPTWDAEDGMLIKNNHINLSVRGQRFDRNRANGYTIDFNLVEPDPEAHVQRISDAYAASLFYANLSVTALMSGDARLAFAYLQRGVDAEPRNPDLWINMAALYNRFGQHQAAVDSLLIAQQLDPHDRTVESALERTYRVLGKVELADKLAAKVRRHRLSNPYYYFALAQQAIAKSDYEAGMQAIERAIALRKKEPKFHHLQSVLHQRQGNAKLAEVSLRRAVKQGWRG